MAYIYTPFMKKVLHITERKWKSNIQHDCKSNDFKAGFEVAEWGMFCNSAWLQISPACFKQVYSDKTFYSLREAQIIIERWRNHYNTKRPHSTSGYRPPAPEATIPVD